MGLYYSAFNRVCGAFFLLLYLIYNSDLWLLNEKNKMLWVKLISTIILVLLGFGSPIAVISVGLVLIIPLIWHKTVEFRVGLVFFIYLLLRNYLPSFYYIEQGIAGGINSLLRLITPFEINYSASAYGLGWLLIIISFIITQITSYNTNLWRKILCFLIPIFCFIILQILYFWLSTKYIAVEVPKGYELNYYLYYLAKHFFPMNGHSLLFPVAFFITTLMNKGLITEQCHLVNNENSFYRFIQKNSKYGLILIFSLVLFVLYGNIKTANFASYDHPHIYVYDTKMDFETIPSEDVYGVHNGLFGMIFHYFRDLGCQIQLGVDWNKISPEAADLLLMINPHGKMEPTEKEKILSFINKGGRLLLLGDHTHMFGLDNDYFNLTKELGISFNFDTAIYFRYLWRGCLRSPYLTWDRMLKDKRYSPNIVQGASLTATYPAVPLIIGEYGWSDMGDLENEPGYLGDRIYETHERTGDLVLAAKRDYGMGQIIVFGDTSFIQNSPFSTSYPFIRLYLSYLLSNKKNRWRILLPLLFLVLTLLYALNETSIKKYTRIPAIMFSLLIMLTFVTLALVISSKNTYFNLPETTESLRAGIDNYFYPVYYNSDWDWTNRGIGGLKNTLIREKFLPYVAFNLNAIKDHSVEIFFLIGPYKKLLKGEVESLIGYVEQGGNLFISAGYEHKEQITEISKRIGIKILNIPYSCLEGNDTNLGLRFVSAWPLAVEQDGEWNIICKTWDDKPLIAERRIGSGRVIFVGDSYFFENRNLEMSQLYYKNNMGFLRNLLLSIINQKVSR